MPAAFSSPDRRPRLEAVRERPHRPGRRPIGPPPRDRLFWREWLEARAMLYDARPNR